jgi:hypothetical protein
MLLDRLDNCIDVNYGGIAGVVRSSVSRRKEEEDEKRMTTKAPRPCGGFK